MEEFSITLTAEMMSLVVVVGALLQVAKKIKALEQAKQWFPYIGIGIAFALCSYSGVEVEDPIMTSVLIGLVASGGYDLLRAPTK